jgi:NADH dehydrogenase (ubiquinone) Fe-S protein 3
MLLTYKNITKILPIIRLDLYNYKDSSLLIPTKYLNKILILIKYHFNYQFKILTCISGVDYPKNYYRFQVVYEFLSLKFNTRLRVKILITDLIPISTIEQIFLTAT